MTLSKIHIFKTIIFLISSLFFINTLLLSCSSKKESELEFELEPTASFILPGIVREDSTACYMNDINSPRIHFENAQTLWKGEGKFYPVMIRLKFKASGVLTSDYTCEISAGEGYYDSLVSFLGEYDLDYIPTATTTDPLISDCHIECGNLPIAEKAKEKAFKIYGKAQLIGYVEKTENGEKKQVPVKASSKISIENLP